MFVIRYTTHEKSPTLYQEIVGRVAILFRACFRDSVQDHLLHRLTSLLSVILPAVTLSGVTAFLMTITNATVI